MPSRSCATNGRPRGRRCSRDDEAAGGTRPSHAAGRARHRGSERVAPDRGESPIVCPGDRVVADPFELEQSRVFPGGRAVSATWDQDEAYRFVEDLFAKHQHEIYAYLVRMLRDP